MKTLTKSLTIVDIAKMAGVSQRTVSGILNDNIKVTPETRQRVLEVIKENKFSPNVSARHLRSRNTDTSRKNAIGLVFSEAIGGSTGIRSEFFSQIFGRAIREARNSKLKFFMDLIPNEYSEAMDVPAMIADNSVSGLIAVGWVPENFIEQLLRLQVPLVSVQGDYNKEGVSQVVIDEFKGAYELVSHMIRAGHRRIALLDMKNFWCYRKDKLNGYKKALEDNGIAFDEKLAVAGAYSDSGTVPPLAEILLAEKPTAIFAADDGVALKIQETMEAKGLKVPDDISVAGFDNTQDSVKMKPALTTVEVFFDEIGKIAVKKLNELINHQSDISTKTVVQPKLVIRDSVKIIKL